MFDLQKKITESALEAAVWKRQATRDFLRKYPDADYVTFTADGGQWVGQKYYRGNVLSVKINIGYYENDQDITDIANAADSEGLFYKKILESKTIRGVLYIAHLQVSAKFTEDQKDTLRSLGKLTEEYSPGYSYQALTC